jgi:hypothetical protein
MMGENTQAALYSELAILRSALESIDQGMDGIREHIIKMSFALIRMDSASGKEFITDKFLKAEALTLPESERKALRWLARGGLEGNFIADKNLNENNDLVTSLRGSKKKYGKLTSAQAFRTKFGSVKKAEARKAYLDADKDAEVYKEICGAGVWFQEETVEGWLADYVATTTEAYIRRKDFKKAFDMMLSEDGTDLAEAEKMLKKQLKVINDKRKEQNAERARKAKEAEMAKMSSDERTKDRLSGAGETAEITEAEVDSGDYAA